MDLRMLSSQVLLLLAGLARLLADGFSDQALVCLLLAVLLALLLNLLAPRHVAYLPYLAFIGLCFVLPQLLVFAPLMLYLCLSLPRGGWLVVLLALPLFWHPQEFGFVQPLLLLAAALLWFKDHEARSLQARLYTAMDDSSERSLRQQGELHSLQQEQEASVKLAVAQERNRIARDIHDNVGHILSRSLLQVKALRLRLSDPVLAQEAEELQASLATGMNAIRHSVHNTRQDSLHLDREIQALIKGFSFCPVRYANSSTSELSLQQKYVVMAIIREAFSNISRHSDASLVTLTLSEVGASHLLLVADNGKTKPSNKNQGMGLAAMEERVRGLSGSIHITRDQGFRILVTLPKEETA